MSSDDHAALLAGGRGFRIGRAKATVALGGRALIEWPLEALRAAGLETAVVAKPGTELPQLDVEIWREPVEPSHPLLGIITALERSGGEAVIVCACDMPFVEPALFELLAGSSEPLVVLRAGELLQPLLGRYDPSLIGALRGALSEQRSMYDTVEKLGPRVIGEAELDPIGDPARMLFNVNAPADLEQAEVMLARGS